MSRVINLNASIEAVEAMCGKHALRISTIEPLSSGGSRVVLLDGRDADHLRTLMKNKLIAGAVTRSPLHIARQPPPSSRW